MSNQRTFWFPEFMDAIKNTDTDRETYHCYVMSLFSLGHWILEKSNCRTILVRSRAEICIGNIKKAMWVFNCLGRSGWFGQSEIILQTDKNFTTKDPWQFSIWYSKNYPNQNKFGSLALKPKKEWLKKLMDLNHNINSFNQSENCS